MAWVSFLYMVVWLAMPIFLRCFLGSKCAEAACLYLLRGRARVGVGVWAAVRVRVAVRVRADPTPNPRPKGGTALLGHELVVGEAALLAQDVRGHLLRLGHVLDDEVGLAPGTRVGGRG